MTLSLRTLFLEIEAFLKPLRFGTLSPESVVRLIGRLGYDRQANTLSSTISSLWSITQILEQIETDTLNSEDLLEGRNILTLLERIQDVVQNVGDLENALVADGLPANLASDLQDLLLVNYLYARRPALYRLGILAGAISVDIVPASGDPQSRDQSYSRISLQFGRFIRLLTDPAALLDEVYGWGTNVFDDLSLIQRVGKLADAFNIGVAIGEVDENIVSSFLPSRQNDIDRPWQLEIPLFYTEEASGEGQVSLILLPIEGNSQTDSGIGIIPALDGTIDAEIEITEDLSLVFEGALEIAGGVLIAVRPQSGIAISTGLTDGITAVKGDFRIGLRLNGSEPIGLFDAPGVAVRLNGLELALLARFNNTSASIGVELVMRNAEIAVDSSAVDGFLEKVLPSNPMKVGFDLTLGFSSDRGLYLSGSGGFELTIPLHLRKGPIEIPSLHLGLAVAGGNQEDRLGLKLGTTIAGELGPFSFLVDRLGIEVLTTFPPNNNGNLGPVDIGLGFLPPTGLGLSIDAGGLVGGGFLDLDHENKRYSGILALSYGDIGLAAIGLIDTKLPDGSNGFALLLNLSVSFSPPIQLGLGFTLSAVGGLIGVNRTMNTEALRRGLRNKALDSILFPDPDTIIPNAQKIISDLRAVFPPEEGRFIIGPMVKFGWGTPNIITADVGIFLELPSPIRIAFMGQLEMALPKPDAAVIEIHLDILGILDFEKKELSFQASLYDSRIAFFVLYGDSAVLLRWGNNPEFALSVGGFHPKFVVPPPPSIFGDMRRLTFGVSAGSFFQLSCTSYLAVTSNSVQFGARAELYVSVAVAEVRGYLSFDALIYLSPFSFEIRLAQGFQIKVAGKTLAGIHVDMTLSGPRPWNARGFAQVKLLFFEVDVGFNITIGKRERATLPAVDPLPPLMDALGEPSSWGEIFPKNVLVSETLADVNEDGQDLLFVHPLAAIEVRQNTVPLEMRLETYRNAPVASHNEFELEKVEIGPTTVDGVANQYMTVRHIDIEEHFARGQFEILTNDQRLSAPSFEKMKGGVRLAETALRVDGKAETLEATYESILIKDGDTKSKKISQGVPWLQGRRLLRQSAAHQSAARSRGLKRYSDPGKPPQMSFKEISYTIVERSNLQVADLAPTVGAIPAEGVTKMRADDLLKRHFELEPEDKGTRIVVPIHEVAA